MSAKIKTYFLSSLSIYCNPFSNQSLVYIHESKRFVLFKNDTKLFFIYRECKYSELESYFEISTQTWSERWDLFFFLKSSKYLREELDDMSISCVRSETNPTWIHYFSFFFYRKWKNSYRENSSQASSEYNEWWDFVLGNNQIFQNKYKYLRVGVEHVYQFCVTPDTNTCENITFPDTSYFGGNNNVYIIMFMFTVNVPPTKKMVNPKQPSDEVAPAKRRGRPAKPSLEVTPNKKMVNPKQPSDEVAPAKRRGRPAKPSLEVTPTKKMVNPKQPSHPPTKRRGRPAKPSLEGTPTKKMVNPKQPSHPPTKRRGRPAKQSLEVTPTKRGRGRPKKVSTVIEWWISHHFIFATSVLVEKDVFISVLVNFMKWPQSC